MTTTLARLKSAASAAHAENQRSSRHPGAETCPASAAPSAARSTQKRQRPSRYRHTPAPESVSGPPRPPASRLERCPRRQAPHHGDDARASAPSREDAPASAPPAITRKAADPGRIRGVVTKFGFAAEDQTVAKAASGMSSAVLSSSARCRASSSTPGRTVHAKYFAAAISPV